MKKLLSLFVLATLILSLFTVIPVGANAIISNSDFEVAQVAKEIPGWTKDNGADGYFNIAPTGGAVDNGKALMISNTNATGAIHQNVTVEKNKLYMVSFYAKTSEIYRLGVTIVNTDGSVTFGTVYPAKNTETWTPYKIIFNSGNSDSIVLKVFTQIDEVKSGGLDKFAIQTLESETFIDNASFEDGDKWWVKNTQSADVKFDNTVAGKNGQNSVSWANAAGANGVRITQDIKVMENQNYKIGFYAKCSSINRTSVDVVDANNLVLGELLTSWSCVLNSNDWNYYTLLFNSGANTNVKLRINDDEIANDYSCAYDDFSITKVEGDSNIYNPSFEEGDLYWTKSGNCAQYKFDNTVAGYNGNKSLSYTRKFEENGAIFQPFFVKPNTNYVVQFYAKATTDNNRAVVAVLDPAQAFNPPTTNDVLGNMMSVYNSVDLCSDWQSYKIEFNSGANSILVLRIYDRFYSNTAAFDDFKINEKTSIVYNGDFTDGFDGWAAKEGAKNVGTGTYTMQTNGGINSPSFVQSPVVENRELFQRVSLEANTDYALIYYWKGVHSTRLAAFVSGLDNTTQIYDGTSVGVPENLNDWSLHYATFNSGANTEATLRFRVLVAQGGDTDDYLDNIRIVKLSDIVKNSDGTITQFTKINKTATTATVFAEVFTDEQVPGSNSIVFAAYINNKLAYVTTNDFTPQSSKIGQAYAKLMVDDTTKYTFKAFVFKDLETMIPNSKVIN